MATVQNLKNLIEMPQLADGAVEANTTNKQKKHRGKATQRKAGTGAWFSEGMSPLSPTTFLVRVTTGLPCSTEVFQLWILF